MKKVIFFLGIVLLSSCNEIETADSLSKSDIKYLHSLGLLDDSEKLYKFYSNFRIKNAGNFFTNKRIASYWRDDRDSSKNHTSFAFYADIKSIDTIYYAGLTYTPYMLVTKNDRSQFKVCVEGKKDSITLFFTEAINLWRQNKKR